MIVFLKKVRTKTIFSRFEPVKVEPLELEYLKAVLEDIEVENYIVDDLYSLNEPKVIPDIVVLTGYNISEAKIIEEAKRYKKDFSRVKIIVGGVHVQLNSTKFHKEYVDYVFTSQCLNSFKNLIESIRDGNKKEILKGVDSNIYNENLKKKEWNIGEKEFVNQQEEMIPDRTAFYRILDSTRFLEKRRVALIKASIGCKYKCSFCYCKELNGGRYIPSDYDKMAREIESIDSDFFWIVDDVLFSNRRDALRFIDTFKKINPKKLIVYLRADFILENLDLLSKLKEVGLTEVIVGFETNNNEELKGYEKTTDALDYPKVISSLKKEKIDLSALFIVNPDYRLKDFKKLGEFIKKNKIEIFTISILTPIRGTKTYELLKNDLTTTDPKKFDFLHLVLPSKLPRVLFYLAFYGLHLRLITSKRIWKYILKK
ncbi:MAG: B12-binding domain-containing radical SAM protein [Eubacteriales bacterium]